MVLGLAGGARRPVGQLNPKALYWMGPTKQVMMMAGDNIERTRSGGQRITHPDMAAHIMNLIYSNAKNRRTQILEGFDIHHNRVEAKDAGRIREDVRSMGEELALQLFQRLLDMESSYDLRGFANLVYRALHQTDFSLSLADLMDPAMTKLLALPGCAVLGCTYGPKFTLTYEADRNKLIYDPSTYGGSRSKLFEFDATKDKFRINQNGFVEISKNGGAFETAALPWVFAYAFAQAGLSGLRLTMTSYQPETAIGGMGMSNNLLDAVLYNLHFLLNSGATLGDIYSQGGFLEKLCFNRETGKQESQQNVSGGHNLLLNAPGIFGGIMRRLDLREQAAEIRANLHLTVYDRPLGDVKRPAVNDAWVRLSNKPENLPVFMWQKQVAQGEIEPFLRAANEGGSIDWQAVIKAYDTHRAIRTIMESGYVGTDAQIEFYNRVRELGGTVMPLGEGTLTAACGTLLNDGLFQTLDMPPLTAADALRTEGLLRGTIPFELLDKTPDWGAGYHNLAQSKKYGFPRPPLELVEYGS